MSIPTFDRTDFRAIAAEVKENQARLNACDRHEFEPVPDWRSHDGGLISRRKVTCRRCGGRLNGLDTCLYLRGLAHGSGASYDALVEAVFPGKPS